MITVNPDCHDGKHRACDGRGWDDTADDLAPCPCECHEAMKIARRFRNEIGGAYVVVGAAIESDHVGVVQHEVTP